MLWVGTLSVPVFLYLFLCVDLYFLIPFLLSSQFAAGPRALHQQVLTLCVCVCVKYFSGMLQPISYFI